MGLFQTLEPEPDGTIVYLKRRFELPVDLPRVEYSCALQVVYSSGMVLGYLVWICGEYIVPSDTKALKKEVCCETECRQQLKNPPTLTTRPKRVPPSQASNHKPSDGILSLYKSQQGYPN